MIWLRYIVQLPQRFALSLSVSFISYAIDLFCRYDIVILTYNRRSFW